MMARGAPPGGVGDGGTDVDGGGGVLRVGEVGIDFSRIPCL